MFMMIAGTARNKIVITTGNRLMMKVMMKMTDIIMTNFAAVAALFFLKVSVICICSMHYPSSVRILRPVLD
tara:strand:+ start:217 stop:429 length:213 start_codon:yes stop_codon:yes gene_type:complete